MITERQYFIHRAAAAFALLLAACTSGPKNTDSPACAPADLLGSFAAATPQDNSRIDFSMIANAEAMPRLGPDRGGAFTAVDGDYLVETDRLRVVIQQPSYQTFLGNFGGTPIDMDIQRDDGVWHDVLGEIVPFIGLSYSIDVDRIRTIRDGADGILVLAADGPLKRLDFINLRGFLATAIDNAVPGSVGFGLNVPWDLDAGIEAAATVYYVFRQGSPTFEMHTAVCNTGKGVLHTTSTDLIDSGGNVSAFNTDLLIDGLPGFGLQVDLDSFDDPAGIVGYVGESGGYAMRLRHEGAFFGYAGIGILGHGLPQIIPFLTHAMLGYDLQKPPAGYFRLAAGQHFTISKDIAVGQGYDDLMAAFREIDGVPSGKLQGQVLAAGKGVNDVRVAAIDVEGKLATLMSTDADGRFAGTLPNGSYKLVASLPGMLSGPETVAAIATGKTTTLNIELPALAELAFVVAGTDPTLANSLMPLPAKISLVCVGPCPASPSRIFGDVLYDHVAEDVLTQAYVDQTGKVSVMAKRGILQAPRLPVPAGTYEIVVSRGPEFSRYITTMTVNPGQVTTITAFLTRVVDTSGWVSADLHVHTVNSPDSPVPLIERVLSFAGENVEVLVTTDHDYITDLAPVVADLGLGAYIHTVIGEELTFMDIGHFNGYPLRLDAGQRQGGPASSHNNGVLLPPREILSGLAGLGAIDNPVIQVNHPRSLAFGYFSAIQLDTDTLRTRAQPELFRMAPASVTPTVGDTGLFADNFHAFEIYNGTVDINAGLNDLFSFLNLGLKKTGIAVSDTHEWYASEPGVPRSYVYMGDNGDIPANIDETVFTRAIQAGRLVGTNGPFLQFQVQAGSASARIGDTLSASAVSMTVTVHMPDWIDIDTIEIFANTPNTASHRGDPVSAYPTPLVRHRIVPANVTLSGGLRTVSFGASAEFSRDTWLVAVARDDAAYGDNYAMFPMVLDRDELPFAFTNAIFIDADENGRFDPPGAQGQVQRGGGDLPAFAPRQAADSVHVQDMIRKLNKALQH